MQLKANKKDFIWNCVGMFFRLGSSFLLLPFLLSLLDDDSLGLWYVFLSVNSFVVLFQAGFVPTFSRNIAYCWSGARTLSKEGIERDGFRDDGVDFDLFVNIVDASRLLYGAIAVASFAILATAGSAYILRISGSVPWGAWAPAWAVFCAAIFLNMYFSYYESLLRGVGDFPDINKATIASNFVQMAASAGMLLAGFGLVSCAIAFCLQGVVFRLLCRRYFLGFRGIGGEVSAHSGARSRARAVEIVRVVAPNAVRDTLVSIANYAVTTANTVMGSLFLSLAQTGSYSVMLQLVNAAANLATVALTTNQPALQSAFARDDRALERRLTGETAAGFVLLYAGCALGIACVLIPLVGVFKPSFRCDWALLGLMLLYIFLWKQHSMCATFITNTNRLPFVPAFIASSAAGCALTVAMLKFTGAGAYALVLGQGLVQLAYNNWKWPREASRRLGATYPALLREGLDSLAGRLRGRR